MTVKLLNGTYYEFCGGMCEDELFELGQSDMTDKEAKQKAINEEKTVYKNTYDNGYRIESIEIWDPYDDEYFPVGKERLYYEPLPRDMKFRYQMLGRLKADCDYFLGNGNGYEGHLWSKNVEDQIKEMRNRWNEFEEDEKPEWLTWEQIDEYEQKMLEARAQRKKEGQHYE